MALAMLAVTLLQRGTNFLNPLREDAGGSWSFALVPPRADLSLPYSAGVTRWAVAPLAFVLFWWLAVRVPHLWMRGGDLDASRRARAAALGYYASAPFTLIGLALLAGIAACASALGVGLGPLMFESTKLRKPQFSDAELIILARFAAGVFAACFLLSGIGVLLLQHRALRVSVGRSLVTAVALPLTWLACAVVAFGVMPWVIGLLWLMFDSLRA